jgi:LacI family transcriptional regulator, repressor for deo operon, udp, cdd, tsx, nupC, and nupG
VSSQGPAPRPRRRTRTRARADVVTIEEVARRANVSVATVSRALRGLPNVAPATRARVEEAASELGYQVDTYASRLATGRSDTVGLLLPSLRTWYFSHVATGVEQVLTTAGRDVLLHSIDDSDARRRLLSELPSARRRLDGLILVDVLLTPSEAAALSADPAHVVTVGQHVEQFPSVTIDNRAAAAEVTRHLLELGHRSIGLVGGSERAPLPFDVPGHRRQGFLDALADHGVEHRPDLEVDGAFTVAGGTHAMHQLMSRSQPPTAVLALCDDMAMGACKAAGDLGLAVPGDVSIAGFDDHEVAAVLALTTVRQDPEWQGATAAQLLLDLDEQGAEHPPPRHVVADTELVVRASTGPPRQGR